MELAIQIVTLLILVIVAIIGIIYIKQATIDNYHRIRKTKLENELVDIRLELTKIKNILEVSDDN